MKLQWSIRSWPFQNASNKLHLGLQITESNAQTLGSVSSQASASASKVSVGSVDISSPMRILVDGQVQEGAVAMQSYANGTSLSWSMPSFQNELMYDPIVGPKSFSFSISISPLTILIGLLAFWWFFMRK
jgi:hypothetical protein